MNKIFKNKTELIETLIKKSDVVLDVGFYGQGVNVNDENWVHSLLLKRARLVYGVDLDYDESILTDTKRYRKSSAEDFSFNERFDVIFAGDVIEHLSNPGLFLDCCKRQLNKDGRLLITTPNCFNLFNMAEKIGKREPTVNHDHTFYFNFKTLRQLLAKNEWQTLDVDYLYTLDVDFEESLAKKLLNIIYYILALFTTKYMETIVFTARPIDHTSST